ncbi:MAG: hypothetical protein GWN99_02845 [Gemmatimonadetes bacterium]|uniref:Uncharacterized protein n=1 Tax=Candidatus Kutchimonas denitrificans TaxID=3056748 RepID=A0AAE4Z8E9_9BACT|nr:hypothetical protein [Gemmatimonadota bacterium]NIR74893.1 hypothetical protein [Candidatus Kutchimonas denitrificans]NIS00005.1 hypothetical protein [Gemmatimonadota bacterium]NIT65588.1 hypothetical protein [Gemmatimonadota bacterium]NIU52558.1 hypothetical protein [Gemmatimonadota bacterium]
MSYRTASTALFLLGLAATGLAQTDTTTPVPSPGDPAFEAIRARIDGVKRVRATTEWGRVELYGPELTPDGLRFGRAHFEKRPRGGVRDFHSPLPLDRVSRLDVRVGTPTYGAIVGTGAGVLLATAAFGLCGDSCDTGTGSKVGVYLGVTTLTTLVGAMIGRDGWGWRPIYRRERSSAAAARFSPGDGRVSLSR